jgi:hypothetical protein
VNIPENLRERYEDLDCWLHSRDNEPPARLSFTAEKVLIERITRAEDQIAALTEQVHVLSQPVSNEEWLAVLTKLRVCRNFNEPKPWHVANALIAARSAAGKEGEVGND